MGVLCFLCAMGALWLLADLYRLAIRWAKIHSYSLLDTRNDGQLFLMLLAVEAAIVATVGIFFWCLPRHVAAMPCRRCGYELAGLDDDNPTCPECGIQSAAARLRERTCPACNITSSWRVDRSECNACHPPRAASKAPHPIDSQHSAKPATDGALHGSSAIIHATSESSPRPAVQGRADPR